MSAPHSCICGCGRLVVGIRCAESRNAQRAKYRGDWPEHSRRMIAQHVALVGYRCPGWDRPAHDSDDLTTDHDVGVLCRGCNTRKKNQGNG